MSNTAKRVLCLTTAITLTALAPQSIAQDIGAPELRIENFIGTIHWKNSEGPVKIIAEKKTRDVNFDTANSGLVINGNIDSIDGSECKSYHGSYDFDFFGSKKNKGTLGGYENLEDFPMLEIALPANTQLIINNAVIYSQGAPDIHSADLSLQYCGQIKLGDVSGDMVLENRGSTDVVFGRAGRVEASLKGSGDIKGKDIGALILRARGSGDVEFKQADDIDITTRGSGDVEIDTVQGSILASSSGSGDLDFDTVYGALDYSTSGSGDLSIENFKGGPSSYIKVESQGSGDVSIDGTEVREIFVRASGSSTVNIDVDTIDADVKASGSTDVYLGDVSGVLISKESGSADIHID
ncbi:hypothetical protein DES40_1952 [Litorimonas taeanensis]|uniref:Putative auto-transporter adhesin head GIN domain-containing protein n=1 Tax=Litorimonas taeanensis TaxID=568099 RepID=A0A420WDZ5_9PROT|nr:DUF2807 domain-containing protein [Litorimonas taeanensis]RKQ69165.1 hypothetical protein DES40_1952 [Litorimonas taeanensis]